MDGTWIEDFCDRIANTTLPNVFNPYSDCCPVHDRANAPQIRQQNLARVLHHHQSVTTPSIWFGRDLGYRGGRRTGLALTDEATMISGYRCLGSTALAKATKGPAVVERTASVIWNLIARLEQIPVLWNAFPLHPHEPSDPMTNRTHTAREREVTSWTIAELRDRFPNAKLIAIGNDASKALDSLGYDHLTARHPSYGGQRDFVAQMETHHGLDCTTTSPAQQFSFS